MAMDKYEFNMKATQMQKMMDQGDYLTAMKIADTIDWRRVKNANLLASVATIYENNEEFEEAKDILLLAFDRAPVGKRFLFKLAEISVKAGDIQDAEDYYREFIEMSPDDSRVYLLQYMILKAKGASNRQLIAPLEDYTAQEMDERWLYELAKLYAEAGYEDDCVRTCDKITVLFGNGSFVDKAEALKAKYVAPVEKPYIEKTTQIPRPELSLDNASISEKTEASALSADQEPASEAIAQQEATAPASDTFAQGVIEASPKTAAAMVPEAASSSTPKMQGVSSEAIEKAAAVSTTAITDAAPEATEDTTKVMAKEPVSGPSYHMIIEAKTKEDGFQIAVSEIKYFHELYHYDYKVAKTNAEKLNEKGFAVFREKLYGRDLIIEDAGSLSYDVLDEISSYMDHLKNGSSVILVDTLDHFDKLAEDRPVFIKRFDIVSDAPEEEGVEEIQPETTVEEKKSATEENTEAKKDETAAPAAEQVEVSLETAQPKTVQAQTTERKTSQQFEKTAEMPPIREMKKTAVQEPKKISAPASVDEPYIYETTEIEADSDRKKEDYLTDKEPSPEDADLPADYYTVMSVDDFAKYAQDYARQIDCVLSGKTVMAIFDCAEDMKEQGKPLTKASAEEMVEHAADHAEKPSLSKKLFRPQYDKDEKLILREDDFKLL